MQYSKTKTYTYIILLLVIIASFLLANILLNAIEIEKFNILLAITIIFLIALNFLMFFIIYHQIQLNIDKDRTIEQLSNQLMTLTQPTTKKEEKKEEKIFNADEIAQQIIPQSTQNHTKKDFCEKLLINIGKIYSIVVGIIYIKDKKNQEFSVIGKYAYYSTEEIKPFYEGEGLTGQVAKEKKPILISNIPDDYIKVVSGLGIGNPKYIYIFPIFDKEEVIAIAELAFFEPVEERMRIVFEKLAFLIGKILPKLN